MVTVKDARGLGEHGCDAQHSVRGLESTGPTNGSAMYSQCDAVRGITVLQLVPRTCMLTGEHVCEQH